VIGEKDERPIPLSEGNIELPTSNSEWEKIKKR